MHKKDIDDDGFFLSNKRNKKYNDNNKILSDDRFKDVFSNQDFKIDPNQVHSDQNKHIEEEKTEDKDIMDNDQIIDENIDEELNTNKDKSNYKKNKK